MSWNGAAMVTASRTTIGPANTCCQGPGRPEDFLTLTEAAALITELSGVTTTYLALYKQLFERAQRPPITVIKEDRGRTRKGRPVRTLVIRRSDLPKLAEHMGIVLDDRSQDPGE